MTAKRTKEIIELLDEHYGTAMAVYLHHQDAGQLLIATILSAQCTDARVNSITPDLFRKYPDMEAFAAADLKELEQDIRSTGFYHNKAKNIIAAAQKIVKDYGGKVPSDIDELVKIPGVGEKNSQCHPRKYLRRTEHCRRHPRQENFMAAECHG